VELRGLAGRKAPGIAELVEAERTFHQHQGVLGHQIAVTLKNILEQCDLEAAGAIVQVENGPRSALLDLIDQSRDGDRLTATEPDGLHRTVADQIPDAMSHEPAQGRLELGNRMAREVQAQGLTLTLEPQTLTPFGQLRGA